MIPIFIALAGSVGAVSRFIVDGHIRTRYVHVFPWATFIINVSGSCLLGFMSGLSIHTHLGITGEMIELGFCGGYTTFSTASFETVRLFERKEYGRAMGNGAGSLIVAVAAAGIGIFVRRIL